MSKYQASENAVVRHMIYSHRIHLPPDRIYFQLFFGFDVSLLYIGELRTAVR